MLISMPTLAFGLSLTRGVTILSTLMPELRMPFRSTGLWALKPGSMTEILWFFVVCQGKPRRKGLGACRSACWESVASQEKPHFSCLSMPKSAWDDEGYGQGPMHCGLAVCASCAHRDSRLLDIGLSEGLKGEKFPKLVRAYRIPQQPLAKTQTPKGETKSEPKARSRESSTQAPSVRALERLT